MSGKSSETKMSIKMEYSFCDIENTCTGDCSYSKWLWKWPVGCHFSQVISFSGLFWQTAVLKFLYTISDSG